MVRVSPFKTHAGCERSVLAENLLSVDYENQLWSEALAILMSEITKRLSKALMSFRNGIRGVVNVPSYFGQCVTVDDASRIVFKGS